jgi:hypothetical protein
VRAADVLEVDGEALVAVLTAAGSVAVELFSVVHQHNYVIQLQETTSDYYVLRRVSLHGGMFIIALTITSAAFHHSTLEFSLAAF